MINPHPGLPEFDYLKPSSLDEASQFLAEHPQDAKPFSGGTDCFVRLRDRVWKYKFLVDIKGLEGTDRLDYDPSDGLTIGAAVPMNRVIADPLVAHHYPLLAEAARAVASYPLRNRATVVGNVCNASPAGDTIGACLVYGGRLNIHGVKVNRVESMSHFFQSPGKTTLNPGDIVSSISFPPPPIGAAGRYIKLGRNKISDLAIVGVTVLGYPDPSLKSGVRFKIVLASVAPLPLIAADAEEILATRPTSNAVILEAAQAAMDACRAIDDVRSSARYRKFMVRNLTRQALEDVWKKIQPNLTRITPPPYGGPHVFS